MVSGFCDDRGRGEGTGMGKSKKEAEQDAAKNALEELQIANGRLQIEKPET